MAKKQKKFPEQLFIENQGEGKDDLFVSYRKAEDASEIFSTIYVGVYKLVKVVKVTNESKVE